MTETPDLLRILDDTILLLHFVKTELQTKHADAMKVPFNTPFNGPSNPAKAPLTRDEVLAEHRRAHRSGRPSKIESDPELQAFIAARIDRMTFAQIVSEVRTTFPPDRHCSISGLGRWWQKRRSE